MDLSELYSHFLQSTGISTDTRSIAQGSLFFALKGERFNGNTFALAALEQGAAFAIVDEDIATDSEQLIRVEDCLGCLQDLAAHHRQTLDIPVIGITGSNGKTTTKELMAAVLSKKYNTLFTKGNLNNHIGVPLTLLSLTENHELAIVEMGANHVGEIALLSAICSPDFGIITNIGTAHIGEFGGQANIIKGKTELFKHLEMLGGKTFVDVSSDVLMKHSSTLDRLTYGTIDDADTQVSLSSSDPYLHLKWEEHTIETRLIGDYNITNVASAIAVGDFFEVPASDICEGIASYVPENNRSQLIINGTTRIIMDAYNANLDSMRAALMNLSQMQASRKMAILGEMLELGEATAASHREIMALGRDKGIELILIGQGFQDVATAADRSYANTESMIDAMQSYDWSDLLILIKGSRGVQLEKVLPLINP